MKKLFAILISCSFLMSAHAQTYDTTMVTNPVMRCAKITGVKAKFSDNLNASRLGIIITSDNLVSSATVSWSLLDSNGGVKYSGTVIISGSQYTSWNRNYNSLFNFTASQVGVTLR